LKDRRIKATKQTIVKSLTGDYRREHLFTLEQTVQSYRNYRQLIIDCDVEIENHLKEFESRIYIDDIKLPPGKKGGRKPIPELRGRTDVILTQLILNRYFIIICC
jgi:hypothetical protein